MEPLRVILAFIDFGQIGTLTERRLIYLGELLLSLNKADIYKAMGTLRDIGIVGDSTDNEDFYEDFVDLVKDISSTTIGNLDMKRIRKESLELAYRYVDLGDAASGDLVTFNGGNALYNPMIFKGLTSHDLKLGMRWAIDPAPAYAPPMLPLMRKG